MHRFDLSVEALSSEPASFSYEGTAAWWAGRERALEDELCEVETPFDFRLTARRVAADLLLEGELEGRVALECSRCAKRYPHALREPFRLVLEPVGDHAPSDPEEVRSLAETGVWLGEELEAGRFRGPVIRLGEYFGELVALALPVQPLCREDCVGVCSHCGADRATQTCDCADEKIDSPFAVLAGLKSAVGAKAAAGDEDASPHSSREPDPEGSDRPKDSGGEAKDGGSEA